MINLTSDELIEKLKKDKNSVEINSYNHFKEFINSIKL